jgi:hypothetical protein
MEAIKLSGWVGEDKKLVLELPAETPVGEVEVVVIPRMIEQNSYAPIYPEAWMYKRITALQKMQDAGILSKVRDAPVGISPLSPDELLQMGVLPPGSRPTNELVDEDRGPL